MHGKFVGIPQALTPLISKKGSDPFNLVTDAPQFMATSTVENRGAYLGDRMRKDLTYGAGRQIAFRAIDRSRLMGDPFNSELNSRHVINLDREVFHQHQ